MKNRTRNIMKGIGSILDIMPARRSLDLTRFVSRETPADMVANAWSRVGADINMALRQVSSELGTKKTHKTAQGKPHPGMKAATGENSE